MDITISWDANGCNDVMEHFGCHDVIIVTSFHVIRFVLHAVQLVNGWGYIITDIKPRLGMKYFLYPYRLTVVQ